MGPLIHLFSATEQWPKYIYVKWSAVFEIDATMHCIAYYNSQMCTQIWKKLFMHFAQHRLKQLSKNLFSLEKKKHVQRAGVMNHFCTLFFCAGCLKFTNISECSKAMCIISSVNAVFPFYTTSTRFFYHHPSKLSERSNKEKVCYNTKLFRDNFTR